MPAPGQGRAPRLGLVVATGPEAGDLALAAELALAARRAGAAVEIFAMSAGVAALAAEPERVAALLDAGCDLVACQVSCAAAGLDLAALGVSEGSQDDHAALAGRADRLLAFT